MALLNPPRKVRLVSESHQLTLILFDLSVFQ
jgi:hypothetical protein